MQTSLVLLLLGLAVCWAGKGDIVCKKGKLAKKINVGEGDSYVFKTQAGRTYAPNTKCFATYKKKASCPEMRFSCSEFNINNKHKKCKGKDVMQIQTNGKKKFYCKKNGPDVTTTGKTLKVSFLSDKRKQSSGAICRIECVTPVETTIPPELPVEMTIPPEMPVEMSIPPEMPVDMTIPPEIPEPVPGCPKETPKFNTACHPSEEGLTCPYGSQTCCGEISPETVMECRQEMWVGYVLDTVCMLGGPCPGNETTPPASCICPEIYTPVCGSDGKTYSNDCFAKCKGVGLACSGECPCDDCVCPAVYDPVCGSDDKTYSNTCSAGCKGVGIACSGECPCADCICLAVFAPVCGSDGRTYSNECQAVCDGVKTACLGECPCTLS